MKMLIGFLLALLLIQCGKKGTKPKDNTTDPRKLALLQVKFNTYRELSKTQQDGHGFILSEDCDSLLFTGLYSIVPGIEVDITAARSPSLAWYRRPTVDGSDPCYPEHSKSSISRDMFVGLLWNIWETKNIDLANEIWQYGSNSQWVMGEGDPSRTIFTPSMQATLADIIYKLGGTDHAVTRAIPQSYVTINTGFQAHLDILSVLLRSRVLGTINYPVIFGSPKPLDVIKAQYNRVPSNSLFSYAYHKYFDGDYGEAIDTMLNNDLFPANTLPTRGNHKEPWLWQRDPGRDWSPHQDTSRHDEVHTGADMIFVSQLILSE